MTIAELSPPAVAITLEQVKAHLRLEGDTENTYLEQLIKAATRHVEMDTRRLLITRPLRQYVDGVRANTSVVLGAWPVASVEALTGYDQHGNAFDVDANAYTLRNHHDPAELSFRSTSDIANSQNGLEIDFTAGYGPGPESIPEPLTQAILMLCAHWYEHRGAQTFHKVVHLTPPGLSPVLSPYRRLSI